MVRSLALLRAFLFWSSLKRVAPGMGRPGIGFALVALLSLSFVVVAQAQTDSGSSGTPTLTIESSHTVVKKGEAVFFALTASGAPKTDLLITLRITAKSAALDESATAQIPLAAGESATWLTLETAGGSVDLTDATLTVSIQAGTGYAVGNPAAASARVSDAPAGAAVAQQVLGNAPAPTGVSAKGASLTSILVSWKRVPLATAYRVEQYSTAIPFVHYWFTVKSGITGISYTVTGLRSNTSYTFRVSARGDGGLYSTSYGSATQTTGSTLKPTPTPTPLSLPVPSNVRVTGSNYTTIVVQWNAIATTNVKSIRLEISTTNSSDDRDWSTKANVSKSSTSASATGLTCDTRYYLRVRAIGTDGTTVGAPSASVPGRTILCPPPTPSGFKAEATPDVARIYARWTALSGASRYNFGVQIGPHWHSKSVGTSTSTSHSSGLTVGSTYNVRVQACGDNKKYSTACGGFATSQVTIPTPPPTPEPTTLSKPPAPSGFSGTGEYPPKISASWTALIGANSYNFGIQIGPRWHSKSVGTKTSASHSSGLTAGSTYTIRVQACGDNKKYSTDCGAFATDRVTIPTPTPTPTPKPSLSPPPAPSNVEGSFIPDPAGYGVQVSWDLLPGAAYYKAERGVEMSDGSKSWPGSSDHVKERITGTQTTFSGLTCEKKHIFRVRAFGDNVKYRAVFGPAREVERYVPLAQGSSAGATNTNPCTKPNVTVIPLSQRKAKLMWDEVSDATGYVVNAFNFDTNAWGEIRPTSLSRSFEINLDAIVGTKGLSDLPNHESGFRLRVTANLPPPIHGDFREFVIVAGPNVTVNGDSAGATNGKMVVRWTEVNGVTTSQYAIRWREVPDFNSIAPDGEGWQVTDSDGTDWKDVGQFTATVTPDTVEINGTSVRILEHEIMGTSTAPFKDGKIYAVQLNYTKGSGTTTEQHFSAREVYVWISKLKPDEDKKVATFSFTGHYSSKEYRYSICTESFATDITDNALRAMRQSEWAGLIEDALNQWEIATNGFITVTRTYENCTSFEPDPNSSPLSKEALANNGWLRNLISKDNQLSEVRMAEPVLWKNLYLGSFWEMILVADFGKMCLLADRDGNIPACVSSAPDYSGILDSLLPLDVENRAARLARNFLELPDEASNPLISSDILFNRKVFETDRTVHPNQPSKVVFGACKGASGPMLKDSETGDHFYAYATAVHEGGHALGLATRDLARLKDEGYYVAAHPTTMDSVMNYDSEVYKSPTRDEPDCAPYPLDVLAIFSLYQSQSRSLSP